MSECQPKVSIGLPVYNGERFISAALESLLAQSFEDFELIISDNGSTDDTEALCRTYASGDRRIRYLRGHKNLGAAWNFNRLVHLSSGQYFKWAAHDDICDSHFLSKGVELLDGNKSLILCHCQTKVIDEHGQIIRIYNDSLKNLDAMQLHLRFADLIRIDHSCFEIFGLIRNSALKKTRLIGSYWGSDRNLLVELGLLGRFYRTPECLFFSRTHEDRSVRITFRTKRAEWFDTSKQVRMVFPHWRNFFEYCRSLHLFHLPTEQRYRCYIHLAKWLKRDFWRLKRDVRIGVKYVAPEWTANLYRSAKRISRNARS